MASKSSDYAAALAELEQLHRAGQIDDSLYEVHRAKLLTESTKRRRTWPEQVVLVVVILIVAVIIARFISSALGG